MNFIVVFIIVLFIHMIIGIMDHLLNIYKFFKSDEDYDEEDETEKPNKKKLVE